MALFFICHLSSVISVINNKTPERFGSVGNNAYICRQKRTEKRNRPRCAF